MRERRLRTIIGLSLIASHFFTVLLVLYFGITGGFDFDQVTTTVGLVSPMFIAYTAAIITYFTDTRNSRRRGSVLAFPFVVVSISTVMLFSMTLLVATVLAAHDIGFENFEQFKGTVLALEAMFAVYLGRFVPILFKTTE